MNILLNVVIGILCVTNILTIRMLYNQYNRINNLEDFCEKVAKAYVDSIKEKLP